MNPEDKNKIIKMGGVALVVLSIFLLALTANTIKQFGHIGDGQYPDSTVSFSGTGEVFAAPDVATFTFSVTKEADSVDKAQKMVEDVIASATKTLKDEGVEEKDIKTTNYNVYPRYDYKNSSLGGSERVFRGYEVSQTTSVKVKEAANSGDILGKIGSLEVTNVSGLSFTVDDTDELKREARQLAIEEAKEKAEALSKDLGIKLVRIISFYEDSNDGGYPYPVYAEQAMGGDSMSVKNTVPTFSTGENKISTRVTITYEIK